MGLAQGNRTITGKVTDDTGGGLPGVTIIVPGTTTGTSSGGDGSFSVEVPASATQLSFSFVGYSTQVVDITSKTVGVGVAEKRCPGAKRSSGGGLRHRPQAGRDRGRSRAGRERLQQAAPLRRPTNCYPGPRTSGVQVSNNSGQPGGPCHHPHPGQLGRDGHGPAPVRGRRCAARRPHGPARA